MLDYPGPISNFSSRIDVAFAVGYIDKNLYDSINLLRTIRNKAAHSKKVFLLNDHIKELNGILRFDPNMPDAISNLALKYMEKEYIETGWEEAKNDSTYNGLFKTKEELIDFIKDSQSFKKTIEKNHPKVMLSFGLALITWLIISKKEKA